MASEFKENVYADCTSTNETNTQFGCIGQPAKCLDTKSCKTLATWTQDPKTKDVTFSLYAKELTDKGGYAAVALNPNKTMGGASVSYCYYDPSTKPSTGAAMAFTVGYENAPSLTDPNNGISGVTSSFENGDLKCTFTRKAVTDITPPSTNVTFKFDLTNPYYLLLAQGKLKSDSPVTLDYHTDGRLITDGKVWLNTSTMTTTSISSTTSTSAMTSTTSAIKSTTSVKPPLNTKGCIGQPHGCIKQPNKCLGTDTCKTLATWTQDETTKDVEFTLLGRGLTEKGGYAAIALNNEKMMGGASVTFCYHAPSAKPDTGVEMAWTIGHESSPSLKDPLNGISALSATFENGDLSCSFTRAVITDIQPPSSSSTPSPFNSTVKFDLSSNPYYLLLAQGNLKSESPVTLDYHTDGRLISDSKVWLNTSSSAGGSGSWTPPVKAHAGLMIISWTVFVATAILTVGPFHHFFPEREICGFQVWFLVHRTLLQVCFYFKQFRQLMYH